MSRMHLVGPMCQNGGVRRPHTQSTRAELLRRCASAPVSATFFCLIPRGWVEKRKERGEEMLPSCYMSLRLNSTEIICLHFEPDCEMGDAG